MSSNGDNALGMIEGYQVFCNPDNPNANSADGSRPASATRRSSQDSEPPVHFQVKNEPVDPSYEDSAGSTESPKTQISSSLWTGNGKGKKDSKKTDTNVGNVIEQLLRKNEYLLAQNDAGGFKPNPRKSRVPNENKQPDSALDSNWSRFMLSPTSQARVTKNNQVTSKAVGPGRILRPRSPTRKCNIQDKDKTLFNYAVMESKVNDESSEKVFRVTSHEMVCAVSCRAMFMTQGGNLVAHFDLQFYWCNFCPYHTTNKHQLIQHVMDHRFHCNYCRYQSFSRADVIHHSAKAHNHFADAASSLKYCTLLPDYLQIYSQDTDDDKRKRAGGVLSDEPPAKMTKEEQSSLSKMYANLDPLDVKKMESFNNLKKSYDYFDMDVEAVEGEDGEKQVPGTYEVSKMMTNIQNSGSAIQVLLDKNQSVSKSPQILQPQTVIQPRSMAIRAATPAAPVTPLAPAKPFENRPPPPPPKGRGSGSSSNLYWSCGYCTFTSHSQSEIKEHSQRQHRGKPHRYVALIRPPDKKAGGDQNNSLSGKDIEIDQAESDGTSETVVENSQKIGEPLIYKCFHCFYEVKKPGLLKGHMTYKHKSLSLVGLDLQSNSPDKYLYFCPREHCPFRAKNPTAYLTHIERCTPWTGTDADVSVDENLLKCLENTKQLAEKMVEQVRTTEEYSCIYCTFTGCYRENVCYHTSVDHPHHSIIIKDLVCHRIRRRCFVYLCSDCNWESKEKEIWLEHCTEKHGRPLEDLKRDLIISTHRTHHTGMMDRSPEIVTFQSEKNGEDNCLDQNSQLDRTRNCPAQVDVASTSSTSPKLVSILPPVLKCCHCSFNCIGVAMMKGHLEKEHCGEPLYYQIMQKQSQNQSDKFYLCPHEACIYSHISIDKIFEHNQSVHSSRQTSIDMELEPIENRSILKPSNRRAVLKGATCNSSSQTMLKCKYCAFICTGIKIIKDHVLNMHVGEKLVYVNLKKKKEKARSIFHICPVHSCEFTDYESLQVETHVEREHIKIEPEEVDDRLINNGDHVDIKPSGSRRRDRGEERGTKSDHGAFKDYTCTICHSTAVTVGHMKQHYLEDHRGENIIMTQARAKKCKRGSRVYACKMEGCPQHFTDSRALLIHQLAHVGGAVFKCSECPWMHPELMSVMNHVDSSHIALDADITYVHIDLEEDGVTLRTSPADKMDSN